MFQPTILVVDQAAEHRDILGRLLRSIGYQVVEAVPGSEALAEAERTNPNLMLVELTLPGQAAWETAHQLRSTFANIPIVGTTDLTTLLSRRSLERMGFAGYIDKPFDLDALVDCVTMLVA